MPRNKVSDDLDHVRKDPQPSYTPKEPPPKPWGLPKYKPVKIREPWTNGESQLPSTIAPDDPYTIFQLFFNHDTLETLVRHTNEYAFLNPGPENESRTWFPTTVKEFQAYLGANIWMGLHVESTIPEFWNTDPLKGPIHDQIIKHISLKRWQQIDRFFHISKPSPGQQETPFDKLKPLNDTLRQTVKKY